MRPRPTRTPGPWGTWHRYLALNPNAVIPTLEDEGTVVWESHAIVRYLAARYGAGSLWPEDPAIRSRADRWMDWHHTTLYPQLFPVFWGLVRTAEKDRDKTAIALAVKRAGYYYERLDEEMAGQVFVAGNELTMGDIPLGSTLYRYFTLPIERPELPHVEKWYARLQEREAYREHVMVSYEDLQVA